MVVLSFFLESLLWFNLLRLTFSWPDFVRKNDITPEYRGLKQTKGISDSMFLIHDKKGNTKSKRYHITANTCCQPINPFNLFLHPPNLRQQRAFLVRSLRYQVVSHIQLCLELSMFKHCA